MRHIRKFMGAVIMAAMLAGGMTLGAATVEAKSKSGGGDARAVKCAYFEKILSLSVSDPVYPRLRIQVVAGLRV